MERLRIQAEIRNINDENQRRKEEKIYQEKMSDMRVLEYQRQKMVRLWDTESPGTKRGPIVRKAPRGLFWSGPRWPEFPSHKARGLVSPRKVPRQKKKSRGFSSARAAGWTRRPLRPLPSLWFVFFLKCRHGKPNLRPSRRRSVGRRKWRRLVCALYRKKPRITKQNRCGLVSGVFCLN